jgi:hypothetical protein
MAHGFGESAEAEKLYPQSPDSETGERQRENERRETARERENEDIDMIHHVHEIAMLFLSPQNPSAGDRFLGMLKRRALRRVSF